MPETETELHERLTTVQCLRNAHGNIAKAYAQIEGTFPPGPEHRRRALRETLDAVDWIRRALEHAEEMGGSTR